MKIEAWLFAYIAIFMAVVSPVYWFMSHEIIGTVALLLTTAFAGMLTVYLFIQVRKMDARLEDRKDAEIAEGAGELGFFPPHSIWPFWAAVAASVALLGPVFGWWLTILGFALGFWALAGWTYQYYRGEYQH